MRSKILHFIAIMFLFHGLQSQSVADIIANSPNHNTLEAAINAADLTTTLETANPITVFAPTDAAFAALPAGTVEALLTDPQGQLTQILLYHAVGANALSSALNNGQFVKTINGKSVSVKINNDGVFINNAKVTVADVIAENGVVHVIDAVLLPPATIADVLINSPIHSTLVAAATAANLVPALQGTGPLTLFAPTDAAFAALPAGTVETLLQDPSGALTQILLYHAVGANALSSSLSNGLFVKTLNGKSVSVKISNDGVFINNAKVTVADVIADNGVVHVIDAVLLPPTTIADVLINSPIHTTLVAAATAANIIPALQSAGPLTLFAPTDAAFAALPAGTVETLLQDPSGALTQILLYHAVGANALSTSLSNGQRITTLNGKDIVVTINNNGVFINDSKVTVVDVIADNGVVHVIDAIMLPGNKLFDIISASPDHNTLEAAIRAAGAEELLSSDDEYTVFAPTDAAFAKLPAGTVEFLVQNPTILLDILNRHIVIDGYTTDDFNDENIFPIYLNNRAGTTTVTEENGNLKVDGIEITGADVEAENGILHVIDDVILPIDSTIWDVVTNSNVHNTLEVAINAAIINDEFTVAFSKVLESYGPFTFFAPIDNAFNALTPDEINFLLSNPEILFVILSEHLVYGKVKSTDLKDGMLIRNLNDENLKVTINNDGVFINDSKVILADIETQNGVVHAMQDIIFNQVTSIMDIIEASEIHNTLEVALEAASLNTVLDGEGEFTVFAPTDAAFAALPAGTIEALLADPSGQLTQILLYHAVGSVAPSFDLQNGQFIKTINGKSVSVRITNGEVFIDNAKVTVADIFADNGVIHVIDAVLLPPTTIVDVLAKSPVHTTLVTAVSAAGLVPTLQSAGPFTVFAPTDAAFAALPAGTIEALLADPQGLLTQILLYHAVAGRALSTDLADGQSIVTVNGKPITVTINSDGVFINDVKVIVADVLADNGVVHVIDGVLLPPTSTKDEIDESTLNIYPIPTADILTIENKNDSKLSVKLLDSAGRIIENVSGQNLLQLKMNVTEGQYLLQIEDEQGKKASKVIVKI